MCNVSVRISVPDFQSSIVYIAQINLFPLERYSFGRLIEGLANIGIVTRFVLANTKRCLDRVAECNLNI